MKAEMIKKTQGTLEDLNATQQAKPKARPMLILALAVLFILSAIGFVGYRFLRVEEIQVFGNHAFSNKDIIEKSGVQYGEHYLQINIDDVAKNIESDPNLHVDSIKYNFPSKLSISIVESQKDALVRGADDCAYIDRNGYILSTVSDVQDASVLVVNGLSVTGLVVGQKVGVSDPYQFETLCVVLNTLYDSGQRNWYSAIDISNCVNINLTTYDGILVRIGQPTSLDEKLSRLATVLDKLKQLGYSGGTIDARSPKNIAYMPPSGVIIDPFSEIPTNLSDQTQNESEAAIDDSEKPTETAAGDIAEQSEQYSSQNTQDNSGENISIPDE